MITHVAILLHEKIWSLPKPNRHHHIIYQMYLENGEKQVLHEDDYQEGFLDHNGNFLSRANALIHAVSCNQLLPEKPLWDDWLYSENLW